MRARCFLSEYREDFGLCIKRIGTTYAPVCTGEKFRPDPTVSVEEHDLAAVSAEGSVLCRVGDGAQSGLYPLNIYKSM